MVIYNDKAFYMSNTHPNLLVITIDTYFCIFDNPEKAEGEELGGGRGGGITPHFPP